MNINEEHVADLLNKVTQVVESGASLDTRNIEEVGQDVFVALALALEMVPFISSVLGAFAPLFGAIFHPDPDATVKLWETLSEKIEKLINTKIESYHVKT